MRTNEPKDSVYFPLKCKLVRTIQRRVMTKVRIGHILCKMAPVSQPQENFTKEVAAFSVAKVVK